MKTGIELITEERKEQPEKHGFDAKHDSRHNDHLLAWNAAVLAAPVVTYTIQKDLANAIVFDKVKVSRNWKLPNLNYAPGQSNVIIDNEGLPREERVKQLIIAGALLAAEIDRIQAQ